MHPPSRASIYTSSHSCIKQKSPPSGQPSGSRPFIYPCTHSPNQPFNHPFICLAIYIFGQLSIHLAVLSAINLSSHSTKQSSSKKSIHSSIQPFIQPVIHQTFHTCDQSSFDPAITSLPFRQQFLHLSNYPSSVQSIY